MVYKENLITFQNQPYDKWWARGPVLCQRLWAPMVATTGGHGPWSLRVPMGTQPPHEAMKKWNSSLGATGVAVESVNLLRSMFFYLESLLVGGGLTLTDLGDQLDRGRVAVGLDSTQVVLTDVGKVWFAKAYPQGVVYEYDIDGEFRLKAMMVVESQAVVQVVCPMGIPYRFPADIDGETTFRMVEE